MPNQEQIIQDYIDGYNTFNVDKMIKDIHPDVVFENVSSGQVNLVLKGIDDFASQARQALTLFSQRDQKITGWAVNGNEVTIEINYRAVVAVSLPNGLKPGDVLDLKGTSEFTFSDGKIVKIKDIS